MLNAKYARHKLLCDTELVPGTFVSHVDDRDSLGNVMAVSSNDEILVLWSKEPKLSWTREYMGTFKDEIYLNDKALIEMHKKNQVPWTHEEVKRLVKNGSIVSYHVSLERDGEPCITIDEIENIEEEVYRRGCDEGGQIQLRGRRW